MCKEIDVFKKIWIRKGVEQPVVTSKRNCTNAARNERGKSTEFHVLCRPLDLSVEEGR